MNVPLSSRPYSRSSYFCCLRLRQPLPAEIGGGISGGSIGNPDSAVPSGYATDASCTGVWAAGNSPAAAGGAVRLPIGMPTPNAAVGAAAAPTPSTALDKVAADSPSADSPSDSPSAMSGATDVNACAEVFCAR